MRHTTFRGALLLCLLATGLTLSAQNPYEIYPVPHEQQPAAGTAKFTPTVDVVCETAIDEPTRARLSQVLADKGLTVANVSKPAKDHAAIYLGVNGTKGAADKLAKKLKLKRDIFQNGKFDRHILALRADKKGQAQLLILGENTNAVFFGLASLEQMLDKGTSALPCATIYDYADVKDRGVIEGYYGMPYSAPVTKDLLRFMMRYKMNSYMYGAKSDPYHTLYWDKPYPDTLTPEQQSMGCFTAADMRDVNKVSAETKVNFIWAIHPGREFTGKDDGVIQRIIGKFEAMHKLGVRQFAVFVDDCGVPTDDPTLALNARRLTDLQNAMDKKWNTPGAAPADTVKPLHFVPQLYAYGWEKPETRKRFYNALAKTPKKTQIYITGKEVWTVPNNDDLSVIENELGRDVAWWWNYPCNDNADQWLFPADTYANFFDMPEIRSESRLPGQLNHCASLLCNPMQEGEVAKIPLFSVANFAWNNAAFDNERSWHAALPAVVGKDYASALEKVLPYIRKNDSDKLGALIDAYKQGGDSQALLKELHRIQTGCEKLRQLENSQVESQSLFFKDIAPWLRKVDATAAVATELILVAATPHSQDAEAEKARQARYDNAAAFVRALSEDDQFSVVVLEGMASGIGKQVYNVQVAKKHLTPFVSYMVEKAK